jgi:hypothetical protein
MRTIFGKTCLAVALTAFASVTPAFADDAGIADDSFAPGASIVFSNCLATRSDFISNDTLTLSTTSTSYVPVPGMTKVINQAQTGCVIVTLSSFAFASANSETQMVRVVMDGNRLCSPIEWQWDGDDGTRARTHGAVCAFTNVLPGNHIVQMQHRSLAGNSVFIHRPSMHIEHR